MADKKKGYRDAKAPGSLQIVVMDSEGREWGRIYATPKEFSTGSVGFFVSGKATNPVNPEARYQVSINMTLIGSRPE